MSTRTNWSRVTNEPEIVDEWTDCYGQELDPGGIALVLGGDGEVTVYEATDIEEIVEFCRAILTACDRFEYER